jgi:murein L,D-transpeptidase YcbB/YkuD
MRLIRASHAGWIASLSFGALVASTAIGQSPPVAGKDGEPAAAVASVAAQPVAPANLWLDADIAPLRSEVVAAAREGLDPSAYGVEALSGLAAGAEADRIATGIALAIAQDYANGRVEDPSRYGWHIARPVADPELFNRQLRAALASGRLQPWLRGLLPTDARYAALRDAYAAAPDAATAKRLRANLERWRWLPRELGADHIYVNVPSYTLDVVDGGREVSSYTVVVGKPSTPTPQIAFPAQSVVVNPWWTPPPSIARTLKAGGSFVRDGGALRQRPGPGNALGKVKIDMPNPYAIYLHDTPSKALFAKQSRAFSHGCIRVKDVDRLARELVALDRGGTVDIDRALAGSATRTVKLNQARPVYLVYFTAEAGPDGRLVTYEDPYGRDAKLIAGLDRATQLAARNRNANKMEA